MPLGVPQAADGSFELSEALTAVILAPSLASLNQAQTSVAAAAALKGLDLKVASRVWATALVLAALNTVYSAMKDSWTLFAKRSFLWLRRTMGSVPGGACVKDIEAAALSALTLLSKHTTLPAAVTSGAAIATGGD